MATRTRRDEAGESTLEKKGDRRAFLAAAAGAAVGATAATLLPEGAKRAQAASGDPLILGQPNEAGEGDGTELDANVEGGSAFHVVNPASEGSTGIHGDGPNGATGLRGTSAGTGPGVHGTATQGTGVLGESDSGAGVYGFSDTDIGVHGMTNGVAPSWAEFLPAGVLGISLLPPPGKPWGDMTGVAGISGAGAGVHGESDSGPGVEGHSQSGAGLLADSENGTGVVAFAHNLASSAVFGVNVAPGPVSHDENGVPIANGSGVGVQGRSGSGPAIVGQSESGVGVLGVAPGDAPAVVALSALPEPSPTPDGGLALNVVGKARFSTAGSGAVAARQDTASVTNPAVTSSSHITVTFTGDPDRAQVSWVERQPGSGFVVHLSGRPRSNVPFTYLIVEPGV